MWAHWRHLTNTTKLLLPSVHPSPQPKRQIDRFRRFCTDHGRKSLYFTIGDPFPQIAPFCGRIGTPSNSWFLGPVSANNPNGITIGSADFVQVTAECHYTLQWAPIYPKLPLSMGGSGPSFNKWFTGPTRVLNLNGISIGSAVFAGLTSVTDRQTDRPTDHATRSVTTDRTSFRRRGLIMSSTHHPRRSLGSRIYSRELQTGAGWRRSTRRGRLEDRWTDYCELLDTTMGRERTAAPECCASTSTAPWQCPPETCDL